MNDRVADYVTACEVLAGKLVKSPGASQVGAEYDDLVQEGLIDVWQTLERGICPSADLIERRMRDYIRWLGAQIGRTRTCNNDVPAEACPQHVPYETLLPLDDFRVQAAS
jgi:hypothetical protein